jgi:hypothetical protein
LFLFSHDDIGIDAMEQEFGHGFRGLSAFPNAMLRVVPDSDHLLSTRAMRQMAFRIMAQFLADQESAQVQRT